MGDQLHKGSASRVVSSLRGGMIIKSIAFRILIGLRVPKPPFFLGWVFFNGSYLMSQYVAKASVGA